MSHIVARFVRLSLFLGASFLVSLSTHAAAPVLSDLDGTPAYTENGTAIILDADVTVSDVELDALNAANGDYTGASLTIARNGGASVNDVFGFSNDVVTLSGSNLQSGGQTFAIFSQVAGTLTIDFISSETTATSVLVDEVLQNITYSNSSDDPASSVQLDWTFSDGVENDTGSTTVSITTVNDEPTLTITPSDPTFVEGGAAVTLFSGADSSTVEAGQTFTDLLIEIRQTSPVFITFEDEFMTIDGDEIELTGGITNGTTDNFDYVMGIYQANKVRIYLSNGAIDSATLNTLINNLAYRREGEPDEYEREVRIIDLTDSGGTDNGGDNKASFDILSTVTFDLIPNLLDADETPGDTTAVVTWQTNEASSTQLEYGIVDVTENTTVEADTAPRVTDHTVNLSSLLPCTNYKTRLHSFDETGNELIGPIRVFTTTGCESNAAVEDTSAQLITDAGGTVSIASQGTTLTLIVPANVKGVGVSVYFTINRVNTSTLVSVLGQPTDVFTFGDQTYELRAYAADGSALITDFDQPITLQLDYAEGTLGSLSEANLAIRHWTGTEWAYLSCTNDATLNRVSCTTTSFSPFGVFGPSRSVAGSGTPSNHPVLMCSYETGDCVNVMPYQGSEHYGAYQTCVSNANDGYECAEEWALANSYVTVETFNANPRQMVQETSEEFHASAEEIIPLFDDLSYSHPSYEAIYWLLENGIAEGYPDGTFGPDNSINRVEFLKIALRAAGADENLLCRRYFSYSDIDTNAWYVNYVQRASCDGITQGYPDGTFRPGDMINFVEGAKIAVITLGLEVPEAEGPWYAPYVAVLEAYDAVPTSISDNAHSLTRGEMAQIIWKLSQGNR